MSTLSDTCMHACRFFRNPCHKYYGSIRDQILELAIQLFHDKSWKPLSHHPRSCSQNTTEATLQSTSPTTQLHVTKWDVFTAVWCTVLIGIPNVLALLSRRLACLPWVNFVYYDAASRKSSMKLHNTLCQDVLEFQRYYPLRGGSSNKRTKRARLGLGRIFMWKVFNLSEIGDKSITWTKVIWLLNSGSLQHWAFFKKLSLYYNP